MAIQTVTPGSSGNPVNQPLGVGNETGVNAFGGVGILKKTGLSSDIPISTGTAATLCTAYNSDIEVDDIIFSTDATGLAGGTTLQILLSSALIGLQIPVSEAVSSLGANTTHDFTGSTPFTTCGKFVIPQGTSLQINSTSAACTGAGKWYMWIIYRPMTAAGSLA